MKIIKTITDPIKKFFKGMFALMVINLMIIGLMFIVQSCQEINYERSDSFKAKERFLSSLEANKTSIGSISVIKSSELKNSSRTPLEIQTVYLDFPSDDYNGTISSINSISSLSDFISTHNATLQYDETATNSTYQFDILVDNVVSSLDPLVLESKQYLYSKGFTEQDIQDMLIQEGGQETDLVPYVMMLVNIENNGIAMSKQYPNFFVNSAYAKVGWEDYVNCAIIAIGADVLFSLGSSSAASWSVSAMKKAFGAVAKRALGPIGAAIAAVSFGLCIYDAYN
jgi:hypothetical protein